MCAQTYGGLITMRDGAPREKCSRSFFAHSPTQRREALCCIGTRLWCVQIFQTGKPIIKQIKVMSLACAKRHCIKADVRFDQVVIRVTSTDTFGSSTESFAHQIGQLVLINSTRNHVQSVDLRKYSEICVWVRWSNDFCSC